MTSTQRSRCYVPCLEGLEARDLPSTLQVVGPDPARRGAKGPYLNLIVQKDASEGGHAVASRVPPTQGQTVPAPPWVNESLLQSLASSLYAPVTTAIGWLADHMNVLQFQTIRRYLSLMFAALVLLLLIVAVSQ